MARKFFQGICMVLSLLLMLGAVSCSGGNNTQTGQSTLSAQSASATSAGGTQAKTVEMPKTLKIFSGVTDALLKTGKSNNDCASYQVLEEKTGVHIDWIHPPAGADAYEEKFNLLIASGDLPDVVVYHWESVKGGAEQYVNDGVIRPVTDLIDKYMPNFQKLLNDIPGAKKVIQRDNGEFLYFPMISGDTRLFIYRGPIIRVDWLEKLGLKTPGTPDELYEVLKAFRDNDPNGNGKKDEWAMSGLAFKHQTFGLYKFLWPFGIDYGFYVKDGKVAYGPMQPEFTDALTYINKLYTEKLIDPDYILQDRAKLDTKFMNHQVGFEFGIQASKMISLVTPNYPDFKPWGIQYLKGKDGKSYSFDPNMVSPVPAGNTKAAITTANKNPEGTAKWFDYVYSPEGETIMNFGREGESYTEVNGEKKFTDAVLKNPEMDVTTALSKYTINTSTNFPMLQSWDAYKQTLLPEAATSIDTWSKELDLDRAMPIISLTGSESQLVTETMAEIDTFIDEQVDKMIMGQVPLGDIPGIQKKLTDMGIDKVIAAYQSAYDRFASK